jgi:tRNA(fMet)-specific endonuclease VapC
MSHIMLDTNGYSAFKRGNTDAMQIFRVASVIGMSVVVLGELQSGFAVGKKAEQNRTELQAFLRSPRIKLIDIDTETAQYYAAIYKQLRANGTPIPTNDMWIAATALQHDFSLYTYDRHFQGIDGLRFGNTLSDFNA